MISQATDLNLNLLVVTSDDVAREQLRQTMTSDYSLQTVPDTPHAFSLPDLAAEPDVILIVKNTINQTYLETLKDVLLDTPRPVALFVQLDPERLAPLAIRYGITSFVVAGFEPARIPTLIEVTIERFRLQNSLQVELLKSREELASRKTIERAKGLLMERREMNEQEAYRILREFSMRQSKPIREVAETLLLYSEILP